jgi:hypothetical protein
MVICAGVAILAALLESIIDLTLFRILKDFGVFIATRPTPDDDADISSNRYRILG